MKINILNPKIEVDGRWFSLPLGWFFGVPAVNFQGCKKKTLPIHLGKLSYFTKPDFCKIRGLLPYILRWKNVWLGRENSTRSIHPSIQTPRGKPRKIRRSQVDGLHDSQKKWGGHWPGRSWNFIGKSPGFPPWVPRKIIDSKVSCRLGICQFYWRVLSLKQMFRTWKLGIGRWLPFWKGFPGRCHVSFGEGITMSTNKNTP